ncbi:hypothetical protein PoB_004742200 [Plakobranchus ocellatus]|uniref:Uncharacterized protein n=1 Tax=Plakobranchus ocellatus TaxID=259542 RepID=A0AAV4BNI6_9GAST|nr:hypothetical protein PoB_004742200 [Plakobranchus ocellatus]
MKTIAVKTTRSRSSSNRRRRRTTRSRRKKRRRRKRIRKRRRRRKRLPGEQPRLMVRWKLACSLIGRKDASHQKPYHVADIGVLWTSV